MATDDSFTIPQVRNINFPLTNHIANADDSYSLKSLFYEGVSHKSKITQKLSKQTKFQIMEIHNKQKKTNFIGWLRIKNAASHKPSAM